MQLSFQFEDSLICFEVSYTNRKTIFISVTAPDKVKVTAPQGVSEDEVIRQVKGQAKWIVKKLEEVKHMDSVPKRRRFINGEPFMYLGGDYPLNLIIDTGIKIPVVKLVNLKLFVTSPTENEEVIRKAIECWYRMEARELFQERLDYYQPKVGVKPVKVKIKDQRKRWGSCSSIGNLNFNWRAVMAPLQVVDYLIVHELCHLIHLNHSRDFWQLVMSILPDYKERREWLKQNGSRLII